MKCKLCKTNSATPICLACSPVDFEKLYIMEFALNRQLKAGVIQLLETWNCNDPYAVVPNNIQTLLRMEAH